MLSRYDFSNPKHATRDIASNNLRRNELGDEASPSSRCSMKRGKIMSTTSHFFKHTHNSARRRMTLSRITGTASFSLPSSSS
uniref:Uncharacterized protein n=1 Tax=Arundo donax TaxID=35708 RepID=A0A0A9D8V7_ARUDO